MVVHGTNPFLADTDGDGIGDTAEIDAGTDPLDMASFPAEPSETPEPTRESDDAVASPAALGAETLATPSAAALDPDGDLDLGAPGALRRLREDPRAREGWLALEEGAAKAALALTASVPSPHEVLVSGRLASAPGVLDALAERLQRLAPVRPALAVKSAARGAAMLADGLAGGSHAPLVARMRLQEARGGVLDHLRMYGADRIELG
jgi:hypothetical protein